MRGIIQFIFLFFFMSIYSQKLYKGQGNVLFVSDAPLEVIRAESKNLAGIIDFSKMQFAFKINVSSFDGFNSGLQKEHFNEHYLETEKYPDATFTGKLILDEECSKNCSTSGVSKGKLTIHNQTQIVSFPISFKLKDSVIYLSSQFNVLLDDYNIKIPRIVEAKISPEINVTVEIELKAQQ